jgi:hypothetical protein
MVEPVGHAPDSVEAWRNHALQACLFQVLARDLKGAKDISDAAVIWCAIQVTEEKAHRHVTSRAIARKVMKQMYAVGVKKFKTLQTKAANQNKLKVRTRVGMTHVEM